MLKTWLEKRSSKKELQFLLSHKKVCVKSLAWHLTKPWLAQTSVTASNTLWVLPDSVAAHAWLNCLPLFMQPHTALLGGDFPPSQEQQWKQQLHQSALSTVVLTAELAEKWLRNGTTPSWFNHVTQLTWVDCLPSKALLSQITQANMHRITFLNPPMALPEALLISEETLIIPSLPPKQLPPASGALHKFAFNLLATEALLRQVKARSKNQAFIIVCSSEETLLQCQKLLVENQCYVLSLSGSMPWQLFKQHLANYQLNTQTTPILLLEESTLPAFLQQMVHPNETELWATWQWVWLAPPKNPLGIGLVCEALPFPLQIQCHFVKESTVFKQLSLAWQWHILQKATTFSPRTSLPKPPPLSQWGTIVTLNRLLYF